MEITELAQIHLLERSRPRGQNIKGSNRSETFVIILILCCYPSSKYGSKAREHQGFLFNKGFSYTVFNQAPNNRGVETGEILLISKMLKDSCKLLLDNVKQNQDREAINILISCFSVQTTARHSHAKEMIGFNTRQKFKQYAWTYR